uniref:Uncharacterized protein n=1 Tax=Chromera velia CCMP2878 TaxID=1169474 RepID=A0A0G4FY90_9ALVE|eukprot:Cvel_3875.t1-p1 / transcript=Cvel_3875.t1 / gene=Cvel_3875 / organism=Chromera_velia_CCMP2878 / gene_product=hypothetical protein / transcript_product=hypothetical protein / location=Cvel_scaffold164:29934-30161(+) / protein_length=76 / sequence_SO=supercontig / SO=protein_coding / is_pseudo=false
MFPDCSSRTEEGHGVLWDRRDPRMVVREVHLLALVVEKDDGCGCQSDGQGHRVALHRMRREVAHRGRREGVLGIAV